MKNGTVSLWIFGLLMFPGTALAAWGENWGEMSWGLPVFVPSVQGVGLIVLALSLSATAAWRLRKRRSALGLPVLLVLLAIPLVVVAGTVSVPNTFVNSTVADADEVNANFNSVETAVNDNDSRITAVDNDAAAAQSTADAAATDAAAAQSTADTAATDAATAQATADAAQVRVGATCAAGSSIRVIAADGTVTCEEDTNTTYTAGSGLSLTGTTFSTGPQGPHDRPGSNNTAVGSAALRLNTTGSSNTGIGQSALDRNTDGSSNTATGRSALRLNTTGNSNTAVGKAALELNTAGSSNIAVGASAGRNTTGSNNILIGNEGVGAESNTIRIGTTGTHLTTELTGDVNASTLTVDGTADVNGGTLSLDNGTSNLVDFGINGVAPPAEASAGWKLRLYDGAAVNQDYGLGIESNTLWLASNSQFKFYIEDASPGGTYVNHMTLSETGMDLVGDLNVAEDITFGPGETSLTAALASAGGGVQDINQTCAESTGCFSGDAEGFPVTISTAGSYRLTSNLVVPDVNTDAIYLTSNDVGIDLNNFAIIRSGCESSCTVTSGSGYGIKVSTIKYGISVKNGNIVGMGDHGVAVGSNSAVSNVTARWNGENGIDTDSGATVSGNTVYGNGNNGIFAGWGSTVSGNAAYGNTGIGIFADDGSTISGNTAHSNVGSGIRADDGSTVSGNTVYGNTSYGLWLNGAAYSGNVISNNTGGTVFGTAVQLGQNACNGNTTCP